MDTEARPAGDERRIDEDDDATATMINWYAFENI